MFCNSRRIQLCLLVVSVSQEQKYSSLESQHIKLNFGANNSIYLFILKILQQVFFIRAVWVWFVQM